MEDENLETERKLDSAQPEQDSDEVVDTEDGGAIVTLPDEEEDGGKPINAKFMSNLADGGVPEYALQRVATSLVELIEKDKEARKERDRQYAEGLRRTGLGDEAPGGADFQGASKVVHPVMLEAAVDFASRAMKEIFPAGGPAKDFIVGTITQDKVKKAKRKTALMNWQLTVQSQEFRSELEQALTQVPLGGAQYLKASWNHARNRPGFVFVAIDDMFLPYAASSFIAAGRKTHRQYLTTEEYKARVKSGMYRDVDLAPTSMEPEQSEAGQANDKIEGREAVGFNEDGLREVYECQTVLWVEEDKLADGPSPYIITIDKTTGKVLSLYRNWDEEDKSIEPLEWCVELPFIPWRGAYPIGLPHMIGGLSAAATGALRALLDSAHIQNTPAALKLKGGTNGQSRAPNPGEVLEIEGGLNVDDIRKLAMPMPFNAPSPTLFSLLGFLVDAAKSVVRTSMDNLADQNPNAPVGTTMALIQEGLVVYSAIHGRLHDAMARLLRILHRMNADYLDDENIEAEAGEELASRKDFNGPMDVVPVSDPNIFSETQRVAQVQAVAQRAAALPTVYNLRKVEERILETLKVPNASDLLVPPVEPREQNAVNENVAATMGRPIVAFPEQDHEAHIATHVQFLLNPMFGGNPIIAPSFTPTILGHLKEHIALWYASQIFHAVNAVTGTDVGDDMREIKDPETARALDRLLSEASTDVLAAGAQQFQQLSPIIQQAMQLVQSLQPPIVDPQAQVKQAELQQKAKDSAQKAQTEQMKLQDKQQERQVDAQQHQLDLQSEAQLEQLRQDREDQRNMADNQTKIQTNTADNSTALQLAAAEIASGERIAVSTGTGINPNPNE